MGSEMCIRDRVGEALPHLSKEEREETGRMPEEGVLFLGGGWCIHVCPSLAAGWGRVDLNVTDTGGWPAPMDDL